MLRLTVNFYIKLFIKPSITFNLIAKNKNSNLNFFKEFILPPFILLFIVSVLNNIFQNGFTGFHLTIINSFISSVFFPSLLMFLTFFLAIHFKAFKDNKSLIIQIIACCFLPFLFLFSISILIPPLSILLWCSLSGSIMFIIACKKTLRLNNLSLKFYTLILTILSFIIWNGLKIVNNYLLLFILTSNHN